MVQSDPQGSAEGPLAGQVAVVVGGGRGIGRAIALELASAGAQVVVAARTAAELEAVVGEVGGRGGRAVARVVDVTRGQQVKALAGWLYTTFGRVDILVNSAGVALIAPLAETPEEQWDLVVDTNLKGTYLTLYTMLDLLRAAGRAQVVNIASKVGLTGHALTSVYAAAKAGVIGFSRSLARELAAENIRVLTLCPGPVNTPMRWAATPHIDPRLVIAPEELARTVRFLLTMDVHTTAGEIVMEALNYDEQAVALD